MKIKKILAGMVAMMMLGTIANAKSTTTLRDVLVGDVKIVVDGKELQPKDADGNVVEPIIYNGTTYLPVRAIAGAFDKPVYWDGENFTVYLGEMDGKLEYPSVNLEDMNNIYSSSTFDRCADDTDKYLKDHYGNRYSSAKFFEDGNCIGRTHLKYILDMKYSRFKGTIYVPEEMTGSEAGTLTIKVDGKVKYTSPEITDTTRPIEFDISVKGGNVIEVDGSINGGPYFCIGDAGFYQ